jgi:hypothetical protein
VSICFGQGFEGQELKKIGEVETSDGVVAVHGNGMLSKNSKKATYIVKVGLA